MPARYASGLELLLLLSLAGCSGASTTEIADDGATGEGAPAASSENPVVSAPAKDTPSAKSTGGATVPAATPAPAPKPTSEAPAPPPSPCTPEAEPNDVPNNATKFTTHVCGTINGDYDIDFVEFAAPDSASTLIVKHSDTGGPINYRYWVNGAQMPSINGANEPLLAIRGAKYTVAAWSAQAGAHPTYEIAVSFK